MNQKSLNFVFNPPLVRKLVGNKMWIIVLQEDLNTIIPTPGWIHQYDNYSVHLFFAPDREEGRRRTPQKKEGRREKLIQEHFATDSTSLNQVHVYNTFSTHRGIFKKKSVFFGVEGLRGFFLVQPDAELYIDIRIQYYRIVNKFGNYIFCKFLNFLAPSFKKLNSEWHLKHIRNHLEIKLHKKVTVADFDSRILADKVYKTVSMCYIFIYLLSSRQRIYIRSKIC